MNYFNEGCILLLKDFSDFCKQCDEDFDTEHAKSLIASFLQSRQTMQVAVQGQQTMQIAEASTSSSANSIPAKHSKSLKTKTAGKNTDISVDEFNSLSIKDITSSTWCNKILVSSLKNLCLELGLPVTKQTKTQIIDSLIKYKTSQEDRNVREQSSSEAEETEFSQVLKHKPKRRVIASAIVRPVVTVTKRHDLNLVFDDNEDVILVLSETNQLCGFIPKEEYDEDDMPRVLKPTKDIIHIAKNMGIAYEVPETIE